MMRGRLRSSCSNTTSTSVKTTNAHDIQIQIAGKELVKQIENKILSLDQDEEDSADSQDLGMDATETQGNINGSPGNEISDHSSPPGGIGNQPLTPVTPKSPATSDHGTPGTGSSTPINPGTPCGIGSGSSGNGIVGTPIMVPACNSPTYVSLSVVPDSIEDSSTYVTFMDGNGDPHDPALYASGGGGNYQQGYGDGAYGPGAGAHHHYGNSTGAGNAVAYTQENGITYVVQHSANLNNHNHSSSSSIVNNNNSVGVTNLNNHNDSQSQPTTTTSVPSVTRVSPATRKNATNLMEELDKYFASFGLSDLDEPLEEIVVMIDIETPAPGEQEVAYLFDEELMDANEIKFWNAFKNTTPVTVQWLLQNYETAEGVSLPRSTLYYHYIRHCRENKLDPVNAASFGKLIRSVFLGLRTRRLGTRGNSKYHYYGIRLKPDSPLNEIDESMIDEFMMNGNMGLGGTGGAGAGGVGGGTIRANRNIGIIGGVGVRGANSFGHLRGGNGGLPGAKRFKNGRTDFDDFGILSAADAITIQHFLGDSSKVLESLPKLKPDFSLPDGLGEEDVRTFFEIYLKHCGNLLSDVMNFQLGGFQRRWLAFWRAGDGNGASSQIVEQSEYELQLSKSKLKALCGIEEIQKWVRRVDTEFYQALADILIPEVLRPIPSAMSNTIRNFAKGIDECLAETILDYPEEMVTIKLEIIGLFSQALRRRTSLNHLAQAARAVLQNESQIKQMVNDLNRIDFRTIDEQASWVSGCNANMVDELIEEFQNTLANHKTLEQWAEWLENVVDKCLQPHWGNGDYTAFARLFLLKWGFYSSFVIRDLTLRSAASFGSFHLLRLLYDEFLFFIIENRVAKSIGVPVIALLSKGHDLRLFGTGLLASDRETEAAVASISDDAC